MAKFVRGQPITTDQPFIDVDPDLPLGSHRFQLVVVDDQGNRSIPDVQTVTIQRLIIPTPIEPITPIGPVGPLDPRPPIEPIIPIRPVRSIGTEDSRTGRPIGRRRKKAKPTAKPKPKSKAKGPKRPRRGGTR